MLHASTSMRRPPTPHPSTRAQEGLRRAARAGRYGDTAIAHVSPDEMLMLRLLGGRGDRNPRTGLPEFYTDAFGGGFGGGGPASTGGMGGPGGQGSPGGSVLGGPGDFGGSNYGLNALPGNFGPGTPKGKGYGNAGGLAAKPEGVGVPSSAMRDYRNIDNTPLDDFGNFLAGLFGFHEMNPNAARSKTTPGSSVPGVGADWGFDPVGLIAGGIGTGFGVPAMGFVGDQLSSWAGRPFEINMGPSVFGGRASVPGAPSSAPGGALTGRPGGGMFGGPGMGSQGGGGRPGMPFRPPGTPHLPPGLPSVPGGPPGAPGVPTPPPPGVPASAGMLWAQPQIGYGVPNRFGSYQLGPYGMPVLAGPQGYV